MSAPDIEKQFNGVENSPPPNQTQKDAVADIRAAVKNLAHVIDQTPGMHPRYRAEALTNLETAGMFAVKGVFQ